MAMLRPGRIRSAFTLIELITVMVILAIMSLVVGAPTLAYLDEMRSSAAAARMAADIRYVQRIALASGLGTWVAFDAANERYSLFVEDPNNPGKAGRVPVVHPLDRSTNAIQLGSGLFANVDIDNVNINGTTEVGFDSFGTPYDENGVILASPGQVVLSSGIAVQMHPAGGFVETLTWP